MQPRTRTNLLLIALAAALGVAAWLMERPADLSPHGVLTPLNASGIATARIRAGDRPEVRLARRGDGWQLERPYDLPADPDRVERLVRIAEAPLLGVVDLAGRNRDEFGLDPPTAVLLLDGTRIAIAGEHPLQGRRFVESGYRLGVIEDRFLPLVLAPPEALLHPSPFEGLNLSGIETPDWAVTRHGAEGWRWSRGGLGGASERAEAWLTLVARQVTPGPPSPGPGATPVTVTAGVTRITFVYENPDDKPVLIREGKGIAYHLDPEAVGRLGLTEAR